MSSDLLLLFVYRYYGHLGVNLEVKPYQGFETPITQKTTHLILFIKSVCDI